MTAFRNCPLTEVVEPNQHYRFSYQYLPATDLECPMANYMAHDFIIALHCDCEAYGQLPMPQAGVLQQPNKVMEALRLIRSEINRIHSVQAQRN